MTLCATINLAAQKSNYTPSKMEVEGEDKLAIVMAHFGTTHNDTREKTIDVINRRAAEEFSDIADVFVSYSSRMVIRSLEQRDEVKILNIQEMLSKLLDEGYTHVVIQPTHLIEGVEMEALRREVLEVKALFKDIRVGSPLLTTPEDYSKVLEAFREKNNQGKNDAVVLVGHGTYTAITATYAMMDYIFKDYGMEDWHVGTVEGYPTIDNVLKKLKANKNKRVLLMPFMFVSGEHSKNDIKGEWRERLEAEGYRVSMELAGMGENPSIQDIFIDHIRFALDNRQVDILEKKRGYQNPTGL